MTIELPEGYKPSQNEDYILSPEIADLAHGVVARV